MKINYKNTALNLLDRMDANSFRIIKDAKDTPQEFITAFGLSVVREWPKMVDRFKEKIQYISDPFYQAYLSGTAKLAGVIDAEEIDECGTFISRASPSEVNTVFYHVKTEGKKEDFRVNCLIFIFSSVTDSDKPSLAICLIRNEKGIREYISSSGIKNGCTNMSIMGDILSLILFMKYCDIESRIVKPVSKEWHVGTKYVNDTKHKVEILDSTWFTNIVREEGFSVRGHFRLQACGPGLSQRKLRWITEFEKQGYTRIAKVITNE